MYWQALVGSSHGFKEGRGRGQCPSICSCNLQRLSLSVKNLFFGQERDPKFLVLTCNQVSFSFKLSVNFVFLCTAERSLHTCLIYTIKQKLSNCEAYPPGGHGGGGAAQWGMGKKLARSHCSCMGGCGGGQALPGGCCTSGSPVQWACSLEPQQGQSRRC